MVHPKPVPPDRFCCHIQSPRIPKQVPSDTFFNTVDPLQQKIAPSQSDLLAFGFAIKHVLCSSIDNDHYSVLTKNISSIQSEAVSQCAHTHLNYTLIQHLPFLVAANNLCLQSNVLDCVRIYVYIYIYIRVCVCFEV